MSRVTDIRLAGAQSWALMVTTLVSLGAASAALTSAFATSRTIVVWCRDFILARPSGTFEAAVATVVAVLVAASGANVAWFFAGDAAAAWRFRRAMAGSAVRPSGKVSAAASSAGLPSPPVVVADPRPFAYTFGTYRPVIVVSTGLVSSASLAELRAVLAHERYHQSARHPLAALFWEAARRAFFFLPVLKDAAEHFAIVRELAADRAASRWGMRPLAAAMLKTASSAAGPAAVAHFGALGDRATALSRGADHAPLRISHARATVSAMALAALVCLAVASGPAHARGSRDDDVQCRAAEERLMTTVNFSPYLRLQLDETSSTPRILQSTEMRP